MLKKLWSSLPQLSIVIIILALLKSILYYANFNVPIKYYLGLTELGILVADDLFITLSMVLFAYLITSSNSEVKKKSKNNLNDESNEGSTKKLETPKSKIRLFLGNGAFYFVIGVFILGLIGGPIYLIIQADSYSQRLQGISCLITAFLFYIFGAKNASLEKYLASDGMILYLFGVLFMMFFIFRIVGEIEESESGKYTGTKIITNDSTYVSTDSSFYIGQTSNYVFFYNKKEKYTMVLPSKEVKKLELHIK